MRVELNTGSFAVEVWFERPVHRTTARALG